MKAVMKSVSPRICEKVANGDCTILVSKTAPKCGVPFKGYIYCTKSIRAHVFHLYINGGIGRQEFGITGLWRSGKKVVEVNPHLSAYRYNSYLAEGKVIGEFVCDEVEEFHEWELSPQGKFADFERERLENFLTAACLSEEEVVRYRENLPYFKPLYGWHISDLKIYDKPKELSEFANALSNRDIRCKHIEKRQTVNGRQYMKCTLQNCICEFRRLGWQTDCIGYEMLKERKPITRAPQSWQYVEGLEE